MNPSNPNHHRQTTSLVTGAGHYRQCIEAQTRWGIKKFVHATRLPTASWTSGPTTKPAPPSTRDPKTSTTLINTRADSAHQFEPSRDKAIAISVRVMEQPHPVAAKLTSISGGYPR